MFFEAPLAGYIDNDSQAYTGFVTKPAGLSQGLGCHMVRMDHFE